jgi:predicted O-linked N-acetylglucosamine transferase (SPINDLY family)
MDHVEIERLIQRAIDALRAGRIDEAAAALDRVLVAAPEHPEALHFRGLAALQGGDRARAHALIQRSIQAAPRSATFRCNFALVLREMNRLADAEAELRAAIAIEPMSAEALTNLGVVRRMRGRPQEAEAILRRAVAIAGRRWEAYSNLGLALMDQGRNADAIACFHQAIARGGENAQVLGNLASALTAGGQPAEAIQACERAVALAPDRVESLGNLVGLLQDCCDWPRLAHYAARLDDVTAGLGTPGRIAERPLVNLLRCDDPVRNRAVAAARSAFLAVGIDTPRRASAAARNTGPIRVGYASADYRDHPVTHLMMAVLPRHDRSRIHVTAYSYGPDDDSPCRRHLAAGCDAFVDIAAMDDDEAAERIRADGIDILIDLTGHTDRGRLGIFARRAAPVQAAFLGYPGTTGAEFIDYIVADPTVCPETRQDAFSERPAWLPDCYLPCEPETPIAPPPGRRALGLPESGFVFCCFNQPAKIEPVMFAAWMRLLQRVPESVLWLRAMNPLAVDNLKREAAAAGIDPTRLVFAGRVSREDHLARLAQADLVLDTRLYNGHASTIDALLAGAPVLTLQGRHFPSRVSASILRAANLPELVTTTLAEYESLASALAGDPARLADIRARLAANRAIAPLFDAARFVANLERLYAPMWRAHQAGAAPTPIRLTDC